MAIAGSRFDHGPPSPELAEAVPALADRLASLLAEPLGQIDEGSRDLGPCPVPDARGLHEEEPVRKEGAAMTLTASDNANRQSVSVDAGAWVIGIDGSDPAHHALDWALEHASGRATALHLVTAWQTPVLIAAPTPGPVSVPFDDDRLAASARQVVDRLADEARVRIPLPVEPIVIHDNAAHALLDAADHAALLVVGSRGRGGFASLLLGSTSQQCATHARVPTVVVPPGASTETGNRILVGVDGSPNSLAALTWALEFAQPGMAIRVMWAWDAAPLAVGAEDYFFPDLSDTAEARFDELVESTLAASPAPGVAVTREFARGRPRALLAEAAEGADLVVIGARGHGAVGSALLGSVATWVLHHVDRPIAVVPSHPVAVDH
jgi:nucleotide-binding universal stress UspA family protein